MRGFSSSPLSSGVLPSESAIYSDCCFSCLTMRGFAATVLLVSEGFCGISRSLLYRKWVFPRSQSALLELRVCATDCGEGCSCNPWDSAGFQLFFFTVTEGFLRLNLRDIANVAQAVSMREGLRLDFIYSEGDCLVIPFELWRRILSLSVSARASS